MKTDFTSGRMSVKDADRKQVELLNDMQADRLAGSWEWEPGMDHYFWTDSMFFLHGLYPSKDNQISVEAAHQLIHPEDFALTQHNWEELHKTGFAEYYFRIITTEGKIRRLHARARSVLTQKKRPFFRGYFQDETSEISIGLRDQIKKQEIQLNLLSRAEQIAEMGTWQINLNTFQTFYSDNIFLLYGIQPRTLNAHPDTFGRFIHPDDKEIVMNAFEKSFREKIPISLEYRIVRQDEEERHIKLVSNITKNEKGEQLLTGTTHDITERKWLELALNQAFDQLKLQEQLFQQAEQLSSTGTWQINLQTLEAYYSDNIYTLHGLKPQSVTAKPDTFLPYVHPKDREMVSATHAMIMQGHGHPMMEYRIIRTDGKIRIIRQIIKQNTNALSEPLLMGVIQDITEQYKIRTQLKKANKTLLIQNECFAQAEKIVSIGNWFWNLTNGQINYSDNIHHILGVKPDFLPENIECFSKFVHKEDLEFFNDTIRRIKAEEAVVDSEYRIILPNGQIRNLRNRNKLIVSPEDQKIVIGTIQDITHETRLQQQLSERIDFAEILSDTILDTIIVTDSANNILACNKQCEKIHQLRQEEVHGKNIFNVFPKLKSPEMIENFRKAYQGKTIHIPAVKSLINRSYHDLLIRPLKNKKDNVIGVLMVLHDVAQEYELQEQLKERIVFIEKLVESSIDRIMVLDNNLNYIIWNKNCEKYYGISKADIIGKNVLELFPMFKTEPIYHDCRKALRGETIHIPVKETAPYDYSESFLIPIKNDREQVTGILWVMHDLTEIMQAREKLVISQGKLKTAQDIAHLGNWEYDRTTGMLSWSDEIFRMYGYEPASFEPTIDFYVSTSHPDQRDDIHQLLGVNGASHSFINRIYTVDGRLRYVQTIGRSLSEGVPETQKIIGTMQDITDQKNLEDQLLEKTKAILKQYEFAQQAELVRNVSTWQWNKKSGAIFWSENLFRILGFNPYSFKPSFEKFISLVYPEDREMVTEALKAINTSDSEFIPIVEYRILNKDGKIKYLRTGGRVVKSKTDEFVTGTVCDITDYMLLTKKLSGNQQLLRVIIDSSTDAISAFDNNLQCLVWNESSARIYGKPSGEAIGNYLFDILPQFNREDISGLIKNITDNNPAIEKDNHKIEIENLSIEIIAAANLCEDKTGLVLITKNKQR